jgi:hypothetical protein
VTLVPHASVRLVLGAASAQDCPVVVPYFAGEHAGHGMADPTWVAETAVRMGTARRLDASARVASSPGRVAVLAARART